MSMIDRLTVTAVLAGGATATGSGLIAGLLGADAISAALISALAVIAVVAFVAIDARRDDPPGGRGP